MTTILKVTSSVQFEAVRFDDEGAHEIIKNWIEPLNTSGEELDFSQLDGSGFWALRHPEGNVVFVPGVTFASDFDVESQEVI